jgi:hypothetical protein
MTKLETIIHMENHSPICLGILPTGEYIYSTAEVIKSINPLGLVATMTSGILDTLTVYRKDGTYGTFKLEDSVSQFSINPDGSIYYDILNKRNAFQMKRYNHNKSEYIAGANEDLFDDFGDLIFDDLNDGQGAEVHFMGFESLITRPDGVCMTIEKDLGIIRENYSNGNVERIREIDNSIKPYKIAIHPSCKYFVVDNYYSVIRQFNPDGTQERIIGEPERYYYSKYVKHKHFDGPIDNCFLEQPRSIASDIEGNIIFSDCQGIRMIDKNFTEMKTLFTEKKCVSCLTIDTEGNVIFGDYDGIYKLEVEGLKSGYHSWTHSNNYKSIWDNVYFKIEYISPETIKTLQIILLLMYKIEINNTYIPLELIHSILKKTEYGPIMKKLKIK